MYLFFACDTTIFPLTYVLLFDDCLDAGLHGSYEEEILGMGFVSLERFCIIALHISSGGELLYCMLRQPLVDNLILNTRR